MSLVPSIRFEAHGSNRTRLRLANEFVCEPKRWARSGALWTEFCFPLNPGQRCENLVLIDLEFEESLSV